LWNLRSKNKMRIGTGVIVIRTTITTDASQQGRGMGRTLPYQLDGAVTKFNLI
jgi:hypothetical protein